MYNIWSYFLQTIAVSIVAGIIFLLKKIFEDKLSPKWQYSIWTLLAIRILVPVNLTSYVIPQIALGMEMLKAGAESQITSAYTQAYVPITLHHVLPFITKTPQSITDWLFIIYFVGVIFFLLKYMIAYIHLRVLIKHGHSVSNALEAKVLSVCDKYDLKGCKIIAVNGLSSAFICGIFQPVLVVPAQCEIDEKVLLHELLHLKYYDTIQNIGWCILRSLHWCNPWMHIVINQIENDMESMCDQRVLELLEGEERRAYGIILLDMANQKYARIPGTTSISNGGNNISQRISAIVRFKKYPHGMTLVSVCIILILFWPTVIGSTATYDAMDYMYYNEPIDKSMTIARINRCNTVAGAIDMYAKGVYKMNGAYVASASQYSEHERIMAELEEYGCYQPGKYIADITYLNDFYVYNLEQVATKEYVAVLCYYAMVTCEEYTPVYDDYNLNSEDGSYSAYILLPILITYDNGWCIKENGERKLIAEADFIRWEAPYHLCGKEYYGNNDVGEICMNIEAKYEINHNNQDPNGVMYELWEMGYPLDYSSPVDLSPNPNAKFSYYRIDKYLTYTHLLDEIPYSYIQLLVKEGAGNDTLSINNEWHIFEFTDDWEGFIYSGTGGGASMDGDVEEIELVPEKFTAKVNIGGTDMEDIIIEEVTD